MKPILEKRKRYLIDGLLYFWCGGGGLLPIVLFFLSSIKPVLEFFRGLLPNTPIPPLPPHQKSNGPSLRCYQVLQLFMWWKNLDIYVLLALLLFFFTLPSEFQVIISGSKKQQQKDSYQSEVPFSGIPGRTPWKQRMTRKKFTGNLTWK